jgi:hypothetical protein
VDLGGTRPDESSIKVKIDQIMRRQFFTYHNDLFAYRAVKMAIPGIRTDSVRFRDFRDYAKKVFRNLKHDFLYEHLYSYVRLLMKDYKEMSYRSDDAVERKKLARFLESKLDITSFHFVFSYIYKYIDFYATFEDRNALPWFYLKNVFVCCTGYSDTRPCST